MKTKNILSGILSIALVTMIGSQNAMATTYTTIADGAYNDVSIWSTDGGVTPCNCAPGVTTNGDDIIIKNDVVMPAHITANAGSYFLVSAIGSLYGPSFDFSAMNNADVHLNGPAMVNKLINGLSNGTMGANITILNTIVQLNARALLYAGVTTVDGGYLYSTNGNFAVQVFGEFYLINGAKLELFSGNVSISGLVDICADCCITTTGNWTNEATGIVSGSGSATTTSGNMTNLNIWSVDVTWCSNGFDTGMPTPEDCSNSNTVCGYVMLPIELVSFNGVSRDAYNELYWETASEHNSDYFSIMRSYDGLNWESITRIQAAGESYDTHQYFYNDETIDRSNAVAYYRLEQVDLNGQRTISSMIAVNNLFVSDDLSVYPNPATQNGFVKITGVDSEGQLRIVSLKGNTITNVSIQIVNNEALMNAAELEKGLYIAEYINNGKVERAKFIIE